MADDRAPDNALNQFWNALGQTDSEPPLGDLDPMLEATVRRLHAMTRTPPPAGIQARVDRAAQTLQRSIGIASSTNGHIRPGARVSDSHERGADRWPFFDPPAQPAFAQPVRHLRGPSLPLATVLLLLVTLSLAYITAGPGRPFIERRAVLPAVTGVASVESMPAQSSSTTAPTLETIFATTLPAEMVPSDGHLSFSFWRLALAPGVRTPVSPAEQSCCRGPLITHVLAGELTAKVDGPMQLFHGALLSTVPVEVTPETEIVAHPGDTIIHDVASPAEYRNQGTDPVQIVNAGLHSGTLPATWAKRMSYLDGSEEYPNPLPAGPLAVSLVRAVLPPNADVPAPPRGALVLEVGANGDASIGKRANDGVLFNINDTAETIYIVMLEPLGKPTLMP